MRSLIVPRAVASPLLLQTVCAASLLHQARFCDEQQSLMHDKATSYYVRAMSSLQNRVPYVLQLKDTSAWNPWAFEELLLATMFLCIFEITKDGISNWRRHLIGIESFCQLLGDMELLSAPEPLQFVKSLYVRFQPRHSCGL